METCSSCVEFCAKKEICNCPLNAYPDVYTGEYTYAKTAANSKSCSLYFKIIPSMKVEK